MKIIFIYNRFSHHSLHSGYELFTKSIPLGYYYKNRSSLRFLKKAINKNIYAKIAAIDSDFYYDKDFLTEIDLFLRLTFYRSTIFHFLYGENSFRFLGYNPFKGWRNRILVSFHQPPEIFWKIIKKRAYLKGIDAALVVSRVQEEFFRKIFIPQRVFFMPHGVDTDFFQPRPPRTTENKGHVFKCVSVGWWLRDIKMLVEVIQEINRDKEFQVEFNIITLKANFGYFSGLENVNLQSGITDEDLLQCYQEADILLLPLIYCTANNTILEALSCGLPIVSTGVGGVTDYVTDDCAVLSERGNSKKMVKEIYGLFANQERMRIMSQNARKKAEEFDYKVLAPRYCQIYRQVYTMH